MKPTRNSVARRIEALEKVCDIRKPVFIWQDQGEDISGKLAEAERQGREVHIYGWKWRNEPSSGSCLKD